MQNGQIDRFQNGTQMDLQQKLFEIVTDYAEDGFELDSHFVDNLGFDSLMIVEFIMEMEDKFDIEINDDEVASIAYVKDALNLLEKKVNANV